MMDRVLKKHAVVTVVCCSEPSAAISRFSQMKVQRREMFDSMADVVKQFWRLVHPETALMESRTYFDHLVRLGGVKQPGLTWYSIEEHGVNLERAAQQILDQLAIYRMRQYTPALNPWEHNVLGHTNFARILFVGDRCNPKYHQLRWPFFDYGNSSLYLAEVLHELEFDENLAMWTNAYTRNGEGWLGHAQRLVESRGLKVIALGSEAGLALRRRGIPFTQLHHPQYAKRFLSGTSTFRDELKQAIVEALAAV